VEPNWWSQTGGAKLVELNWWSQTFVEEKKLYKKRGFGSALFYIYNIYYKWII